MRVEDVEPGEAAAEDAQIAAVDEARRPQSWADVADIVATLEAGERVRITEDAPGWPRRTIDGTLVAWADGTLVLDVWPWPVRLPSGLPGLAVAGIEVLS